MRRAAWIRPPDALPRVHRQPTRDPSRAADASVPVLVNFLRELTQPGPVLAAILSARGRVLRARVADPAARVRALPAPAAGRRVRDRVRRGRAATPPARADDPPARAGDPAAFVRDR